MKQFTRANLQSLRVEIDNALSKVSKRHNISLSLGRISFNNDSFRAKLEAAVQLNDQSGNMSVSAINELKELKEYGSMFGVSEKDYGRVFEFQGRKFKFTGIKLSRNKYPVSGEDVRTGKGFKFPESALQRFVK